MIKRIILICIFSLILVSNIFGITPDEILKYKGQSVILVMDSNVIPYSYHGTIIDVVTTKDYRIFVALQTNDYYNYPDGIAFININRIIKIL